MIEADGTMRWFIHGQSFRFGDRPAVMGPDGLKHRKDTAQPAVIYPDGSQEFWHHGRRLDKALSPASVNVISNSSVRYSGRAGFYSFQKSVR